LRLEQKLAPEKGFLNRIQQQELVNFSSKRQLLLRGCGVFFELATFAVPQNPLFIHKCTLCFAEHTQLELFVCVRG
jgi:hypothetical protein